MTRALSDVQAVLALRVEGLGARRIARNTGIPTKTVQGWLTDPTRALARPRKSGRTCHGRCEPWHGLDEANYSYVLGMYLGDGHIVSVNRTYRLSITCDERYPRIIDEVARAVGRLAPSRVARIQREGCIAVNAYSCHWPCFFPQHGPGMKHEREIRLDPWQQEIVQRRARPFLRGLIHSDGWRGKNVAIRTTELAVEYRTYTRYQFSNRSDDIRKLFGDACDLLRVHWTQSNQWTISVARRKDVHCLDSFVGPKR